ncbi:hypothetical protein GW17_00003557 [Ensete ventricosum]|uniref:Uncharacterized protein n=1 Tax=Ensete ventricosum TaxID=4639 RepID=A0A444GA85_ENSVE|nr:hypothetical protein GW17_00003557 [Ensete ventricosum]RZR74234.1 hypothetical protein BHM03_00034141 [Ensete ventricosum]
MQNPKRPKTLLEEKRNRRATLRSMFERVARQRLNSGSFWMVRHLPAPCLSTPARSASSSSAVHFCFGAPIELPSPPRQITLRPNLAHNSKASFPDCCLHPDRLLESSSDAENVPELLMVHCGSNHLFQNWWGRTQMNDQDPRKGTSDGQIRKDHNTGIGKG